MRDDGGDALAQVSLLRLGRVSAVRTDVDIRVARARHCAGIAGDLLPAVGQDVAVDDPTAILRLGLHRSPRDSQVARNAQTKRGLIGAPA